jgi:hypothetical protein
VKGGEDFGILELSDLINKLFNSKISLPILSGPNFKIIG